MGIAFTPIIVSAAVGGVDEALERNDASAGRTGNFKTYKDYFRIGAPVLGLALQMVMPKWAKLGEDLTCASVSLLTKSLAQVIMPASSTAAAKRVAYRQYQRVPSPAGQRVAGRSPEFDDVRMY